MREDYLKADREGQGEEKEIEKALRPLTFADFTGQQKVVDNIKVFVQAARQRSESLDHVLLHGPPGLGKTTLSFIIANELGSNIKVTSGPVLDKPGDLAGLLNRRGVPLLCHGRFPDRHHARFRTQCPVSANQPESVHTDWSYYAGRIAYFAAPCALWHQCETGVL